LVAINIPSATDQADLFDGSSEGSITSRTSRTRKYRQEGLTVLFPKPAGPSCKRGSSSITKADRPFQESLKKGWLTDEKALSCSLAPDSGYLTETLARSVAVAWKWKTCN
jgi:hypothetical protein